MRAQKDASGSMSTATQSTGSRRLPSPYAIQPGAVENIQWCSFAAIPGFLRQQLFMSPTVAPGPTPFVGHPPGGSAGKTGRLLLTPTGTKAKWISFVKSISRCGVASGSQSNSEPSPQPQLRVSALALAPIQVGNVSRCSSELASSCEWIDAIAMPRLTQYLSDSSYVRGTLDTTTN